MLTEAERGYLAGILDGEGSITISKRRPLRNKSPQHCLNIQICNTSEEVIKWLHYHLGGCISELHNEKRGYRRCYSIQISGNSVCNVLKRLVDIMIIKKPQALLAIKFWEKRKITIGVLLTEEELIFREHCYTKMSKLNKGKI